MKASNFPEALRSLGGEVERMGEGRHRGDCWSGRVNYSEYDAMTEQKFVLSSATLVVVPQCVLLRR